MFTHILLPLDGSPFAEAALPHTLQLAQQFNSKITLIHIVKPAYLELTGDAYDPTLLDEIKRAAYLQASEYLHGKAGELRGQGYNVSERALESYDVAAALLDVVNGGEVDAVVMSTHGRSGVRRAFFGSIAERVVRHSEIPVLLIRPDKT